MSTNVIKGAPDIAKKENACVAKRSCKKFGYVQHVVVAAH